MKDALRLPIAAAAALAASDIGFHSYYTPALFTRRLEQRLKKLNPNAAKQAAAKRARKITRRKP
ncbi:hypothetical protein [Bosea sp. MMO-172]|uniref:hypothetical protein n=1 Tax=Bosea sp. MMO-172 TaxID=3127885 RepID=UPI0030158CA2